MVAYSTFHEAERKAAVLQALMTARKFRRNVMIITKDVNATVSILITMFPEANVQPTGGVVFSDGTYIYVRSPDSDFPLDEYRGILVIILDNMPGSIKGNAAMDKIEALWQTKYSLAFPAVQYVIGIEDEYEIGPVEAPPSDLPPPVSLSDAQAVADTGGGDTKGVNVTDGGKYGR